MNIEAGGSFGTCRKLFPSLLSLASFPSRPTSSFPHPFHLIRWRRGAKKPFRKDTKGAKDDRASQDDSR